MSVFGFGVCIIGQTGMKRAILVLHSPEIREKSIVTRRSRLEFLTADG